MMNYKLRIKNKILNFTLAIMLLFLAVPVFAQDAVPRVTAEVFNVTQTTADIKATFQTFGTTLDKIDVQHWTEENPISVTTNIYTWEGEYRSVPDPIEQYNGVISGLAPGTRYLFKIVYEPSNYGVQESSVGDFDTQDPVVQEINQIETSPYLKNIKETTVDVLGQITNYIGGINIQIEYGVNDFSNRTGNLIIDPSHRYDVMLIGLQPDTTHQFRFIDTTGTFEPSVVWTLKTAGGAIEPPTTPALSSMSSFEGGLIPCDGSAENPCNFQALMELFNNIIDFLLFNLAMPLAAVAFVYAGFLFMTSGDSEEKRSRGKLIFKNVLTGFVIALAAWLIVKTILFGLGVPGNYIFLER